MKSRPAKKVTPKSCLLYSAGCLVLIIGVVFGGWVFINKIIEDVFTPQFYLKTTEIRFSDNPVSFPMDYNVKYNIGIAFSKGGALTPKSALATAMSNSYIVRLYIDDKVTSYTLPPGDAHYRGAAKTNVTERDDGRYEAVWILKVPDGYLEKITVAKLKGSKEQPEVVRVYHIH